MLSFPSNALLKDAFLESLDPFSVAISCFEDPLNSSQWIIEALVEQDTWIEHHQSLKKLLPPSLKAESVPEKNWILETARAFPPFTIGHFYIHGTHEGGLIPKNLIPIKIDAATAFGSGEHATTKGCLLLLQHIWKKEFLSHHKFLSLLDMGTGSGILAIAMAKLFNCPVLALDNDPESIRVTCQNTQMNEVSKYIMATVSEGFQNSSIETFGPFDLIMANILCRPLLEMAKDMSQAVKPGRFIILSGLLETQAPEIIETYGHEGFVLLKTYGEKEWSSLLLQKT